MKHFGPPRLELDTTSLVLRFEFNRDWLTDLRSFAKWDGKVWRAPVGKVSTVMAWCKQRGFKISSEVEFLIVPPDLQGEEGIDTDGVWILLNFAYERVRAEQAKKITGCTFDDKRACWTAPKAALLEVIAFATEHHIPMAPELIQMAHRDKIRREALYRGSMALDFPPIEGMHPQLDPHQRAAVAYINTVRRSFLADDIGVGKTFESIAAMEFCNTTVPSYPALIICPPKLAVNWVKEAGLWAPHRTVEIVSKKKQDLPDADITVIGWSILHDHREVLAKKQYRSFLADESHSAKNRGAQRTRAALTVTRNLAPNALRLAISGTPMSVRTEDFKPQLEMLDMMEQFGGAMGFDRSFCRTPNEEVLNYWLRGMGYIRRLREEVLDLPPVVHGDITVEGNLTNYKRAEKDLLAYVAEQAALIAEELGEDPHSAAVRARLKAQAGKHLVELSILRKEAALAKIPAALEWIETAVEAGKHVIVGAHHREVVDALAEPWGLKIQGGMTPRQVEAAKDEFQSGSPVIVLSIQAGKEGHTLTAATDCLMVEFPWTSTDYDQTWGRGWRKGQVNHFFVTAMLCSGTRDEAQFDALGRRRRRVDAATQGDGGQAMLMSLFDQLPSVKPRHPKP